MTPFPPGSEHTAEETPVPAAASPELEQERRTSLAAERTWLAWWRTALGATVGALAVGRFAPGLLKGSPWPYVLLGCGYAVLAVALAIVGARRQRELQRAFLTGGNAPLGFRTVMAFTIGGITLAVLTVVLVIAES